MALSLPEIKELIAYGQELGLQQLQTEGLVVVYGPKPIHPTQNANQTTTEESENILAHYSALGREMMAKHSRR